MTDEFELELAERFRKLDQPIQIDTCDLIAKLASTRKQRQRLRTKARLMTAGTIACLIVVGFAVQMFSNGREQTSVADGATDSSGESNSISLVDFESPADPLDQAAELERLRAEIVELKRASHAQKLTQVRESISREMFNNYSTLSLFE